MDFPTINQMPEPPEGVSFRLQKVDKVSMPHPYCITPRHVAYASDHCGGLLGADAIRESEKHGVKCDICKKSKRGILSYDEHESSVTLFIIVQNNQDLNANPGLPSYLYSNKQTFVDLGIQGFAFPTSK